MKLTLRRHFCQRVVTAGNLAKRNPALSHSWRTTMLSKAALEFVLRLTDWFHGHWEDPEWGKRPTTHVLIAVAVRDLAMAIRDAGLRGRIHAATDEIIIRNSQAATRG
jgi:hypothetical protein